MRKASALAMVIASFSLFAGKAYGGPLVVFDMVVSAGDLSVATTGQTIIFIRGLSSAIVNSAPNIHATFRNDGDFVEDFALKAEIVSSTGGWTLVTDPAGIMADTSTNFRVSAIFARVSSAPLTSAYADNDILTTDFQTCSLTQFHDDSYSDPNDNNNAAINVQTSYNSQYVAETIGPDGKPYGPDNYNGFRDLFFKVELPNDPTSHNGVTLRVTAQVTYSAAPLQ